MTLAKWTFLFLAATALHADAQHPATDSVRAVANNTLYRPNSFLRRLLMGSNYRQAWQQPVTVPVFHLTASGFRVKELGGGMQSKSLRMTDSGGRIWALRTVNKHITNDGLSPALRNPTGRNFSQDFISTSHPYGAQLAGAVAAAAGLRVAKSQVYAVADDTALAPFRDYFVGQLCTLEERDPSFETTIGSEEMGPLLQTDNRYKVQPAVYLKARLVDMLLADWDRHAGNWRWGLKDSAGFHFFYAVPRDRDWAFYRSHGLLPWLGKHTAALRYLINFDDDFGNVNKLSWKSWTMDKFFLGELDKAVWQELVGEVQTALSDEAIEDAVRVLPTPVYQAEGAWFISILKNRRDGLMSAAMRYYRFLSEEAVVNGSDGAETFAVSSDGDKLLVRVYRNQDATQLLFERRFVQGQTYAIELNGFGGDDIFTIDGQTSSKIRLLVNGGVGSNRYELRPNNKVRIRIVEDNEPKRLTATGATLSGTHDVTTRLPAN